MALFTGQDLDSAPEKIGLVALKYDKTQIKKRRYHKHVLDSDKIQTFINKETKQSELLLKEWNNNRYNDEDINDTLRKIQSVQLVAKVAMYEQRINTIRNTDNIDQIFNQLLVLAELAPDILSQENILKTMLLAINKLGLRPPQNRSKVVLPNKVTDSIETELETDDEYCKKRKQAILKTMAVSQINQLYEVVAESAESIFVRMHSATNRWLQNARCGLQHCNQSYIICNLLIIIRICAMELSNNNMDGNDAKGSAKYWINKVEYTLPHMLESEIQFLKWTLQEIFEHNKAEDWQQFFENVLRNVVETIKKKYILQINQLFDH
eukprot:313964_1